VYFDGASWISFDPAVDGDPPAASSRPSLVLHDWRTTRWGVWSWLTQTKHDRVKFVDGSTGSPAPVDARASMLVAVQARHNWPPSEKFDYYLGGGEARTRPLILGVLNDLSVLLALGCFALSLAWVPRALRRRPRPGQCPACRYERAGLAFDAPCLECGADPRVAGAHAAGLPAADARATDDAPPPDRAG
jgi:hypothetical protein